MTIANQLGLFKSAWGAVVAAVAAGPLVMWTSDLQPPWPPGSFAIASLACAVAVWLAISLKSLLTRPRNLKLIGAGSLLMGLVLGAMYVGAFSRYVQWFEIITETGTRTESVVVGTDQNPGVVLGKGGAKKALIDALANADEVWTEASIMQSNEILLALFVSMFFFLTLGSASIVLSHRVTVSSQGKP